MESLPTLIKIHPGIVSSGVCMRTFTFRKEYTLTAPKKYSRSLTPAARENLLRQSITAPSLARLAHQAGVTAQSLYGWRRMARDGQLEVASDLREAIQRQLPIRSNGARKGYKAGTHLTKEQAKDAVLATVRRRKKTTLAKIAARYGVSDKTIHNLRARARDGLIKLPKKDLAILQRQMSGDMHGNKAVAAAIPVAVTAGPRKPGRQATKVAAMSVQAAPKKAAPAQSQNDFIIIRNGDNAIEIPASLDAGRMAAVISAAMAA
tara:strand:- start:1708 stop:2496 length:789 start_codon:yes stop_codon:yes gene_type:complete